MFDIYDICEIIEQDIKYQITFKIMSVHCPKTIQRYNHYRKKTTLIVVKYGAEWCKPCNEMKLFMKTLAEKYKNVYFLDVDVDLNSDEYPKSEKMYEHEDFSNITTIPHFKFFLNKKLTKEFKGKDPDKLGKYVKKLSKQMEK